MGGAPVRPAGRPGARAGPSGGEKKVRFVAEGVNDAARALAGPTGSGPPGYCAARGFAGRGAAGGPRDQRLPGTGMPASAMASWMSSQAFFFSPGERSR